MAFPGATPGHLCAGHNRTFLGLTVVRLVQRTTATPAGHPVLRVANLIADRKAPGLEKTRIEPAKP